MTNRPATAADPPGAAELRRRLTNVLRPGVIAALDAQTARARVAYAEGTRGNDRPTTGWLPWLAPAAGARRSWRAPSVGEQALILAPGGNLEQGVILTGLYTGAFPPPSSDPAVEIALYADGARIEYDAGAHRLRALLPAGAAAEIEAPEGVSIRGGVTVNGNLKIEGEITATGSIEADGGISADGDVSAGGGISAGGDVADSAASMRAMRAKYNRHKHALSDPPPTPQM